MRKSPQELKMNFLPFEFIFGKLPVLCLLLVLLAGSCKEDSACNSYSFFTAEKDAVNFLQYSFSNFSTCATTYLWDFGDGESSDLAEPTHTFSSEGTYTVSLIAESSDDSHTFEQQITVKLPETLIREYGNNLVSDPEVAGLSIAFFIGDEVNTYHFGEKALTEGNIPDDHTLYELSSTSKPFTAITVIQWLNENNISLDDPVHPYLPESTKPGLELNDVQITFRHLLNHTSGLPRLPLCCTFDYDKNNFIDYDSTVLYDQLANNKPLRTPGTEPRTESQFGAYYGNTAFGLLGVILKRNLHMSLEEIYSQYLFTPMGLEETTFENLSNIINKALPKGSENGIYFEAPAMDGAGGINSNLVDLIKYAQYLINAGSTSPIEQAINQSMEIQYPLSAEYTVCLPWSRKSLPSGNTIISHGGSGWSYNSEFLVDIKNKKGLIILNNNSAENTYLVSVFRKLNEELMFQ